MVLTYHILLLSVSFCGAKFVLKMAKFRQFLVIHSFKTPINVAD